MPLNRLVAFVLGPAITLASGYVSLWLSRHFPGAHMPSQKSVAGVLTTGVITGLPMVLAHLKVKKWLDGWQAWEKRLDTATNGALSASTQRFLEAVAQKTGTPLPSGATLMPPAQEQEGGGTSPPPAYTEGAFDGPNSGV